MPRQGTVIKPVGVLEIVMLREPSLTDLWASSSDREEFFSQDMLTSSRNTVHDVLWKLLNPRRMLMHISMLCWEEREGKHLVGARRDSAVKWLIHTDCTAVDNVCADSLLLPYFVSTMCLYKSCG